ncbi:peptidylprolyl isomerase [Paraburkholderia sp. Ac-20347]|uniref:peptidylprolyl isomerase n=1 Tax=Paraburkholderia sp. Ac-20347 TaxID=2703892 RepID=UPI0019801F50|nr:peptidylprolyl isomerase [Paraburkholderia sp. Ac-20347]MBN3812623.1 peptidylprolyl isomerase [Paraburkholderia sp. Ac-20347]
MNADPHTLDRTQPARVNHVDIAAEAIDEESRHHADDPDPPLAARRALVVRELLRQRAAELALIDADAALDDDTLDTLLARELRVPEPTPDDCRRYYAQHAAQFVRNEIVYASHILFAVTERVPLALLRHQAEDALNALLREPHAFEARAGELSNCPSGAVGGSLGQLTRGDAVPEFEQALFNSPELGLLPRLVRTRFGFHLVRIDRRVPGEPVPFETAADDIARFLTERVRHKAIQQYVSILASAATLEHAAVDAATSPLVQ